MLSNQMKTYKEIKHKIVDLSGIENPENWMYDKSTITDVYYPVEKIEE